MWTCAKCQTKVDPSFDVCWNCGTNVEGVEDPTFVKADDEGPIAGDPVVPELDVTEGVPVLSDLPEPIRGELVEAYSAHDLMEARFVADQLNQAGIHAVSDTHDLHETLAIMDADPKVYVLADDLPAARSWLETYERSKATTPNE